MKRVRTISALGLLVAGLFVWGQVDAAKDPVKIAMHRQAPSSTFSLASNAQQPPRPLDY